jgi:hypothetical protein
VLSIRSDLGTSRPKHLTKAGYLQGVAFLEDRFHPHDLAASEREERKEAKVAFNTACATDAMLGHVGQDGVPVRTEPSCLDRVRGRFKLFEEPEHVAADRLRSDKNGRLGKRGSNDKADMRIEVFKTNAEVSCSPSLVHAANDLDISLGHVPKYLRVVETVPPTSLAR